MFLVLSLVLGRDFEANKGKSRCIENVAGFLDT